MALHDTTGPARLVLLLIAVVWLGAIFGAIVGISVTAKETNRKLDAIVEQMSAITEQIDSGNENQSPRPKQSDNNRNPQ